MGACLDLAKEELEPIKTRSILFCPIVTRGNAGNAGAGTAQGPLTSLRCSRGCGGRRDWMGGWMDGWMVAQAEGIESGTEQEGRGRKREAGSSRCCISVAQDSEALMIARKNC